MLSGGKFDMGSKKGQADELPPHEILLDGFWMDDTEVNNAQFKKLTDDSGYLTTAEKTPRREIPGCTTGRSLRPANAPSGRRGSESRRRRAWRDGQAAGLVKPARRLSRIRQRSAKCQVKTERPLVVHDPQIRRPGHSFRRTLLFVDGLWR